MSVDPATVKRVAHLARIRVADEDLAAFGNELNVILGFVEQLNEVDVSDVEPMTSVLPMPARLREDRVTTGADAAAVLANAPADAERCFAVPKVVE